jgi:hypothetical protein
MLAEADELAAFEDRGEGDAASIIAPKMTISASAIALFRAVGKADRDCRRAAVNSRSSMIRPRTLALADRVFR